MTEQRPSRQGCWVYFGFWLGASGAELLGLGDKRVSAQIELITPGWVDWLVGWVFVGIFLLSGTIPKMVVTLIKRRKSWDV